jgi:hypothetical protein
VPQTYDKQVYSASVVVCHILHCIRPVLERSGSILNRRIELRVVSNWVCSKLSLPESFCLALSSRSCDAMRVDIEIVDAESR